MNHSLYVVATCLFLASPVPAQTTDSVKTSTTRAGYDYIFQDDPLDASPSSPGGDRIRVRPKAHRSFLLRPRTHFIQELFHSAEDL